jgi:hypothetical protein
MEYRHLLLTTGAAGALSTARGPSNDLAELKVTVLAMNNGLCCFGPVQDGFPAVDFSGYLLLGMTIAIWIRGLLG